MLQIVNTSSNSVRRVYMRGVEKKQLSVTFFESEDIIHVFKFLAVAVTLLLYDKIKLAIAHSLR